MLDATFDLDAYLARIGHSGPRAPTAKVLAKIVERHTLTIAFENLDILLGRPIRLDVASIEAKLVRSLRGGYCFEHNTLLCGVLRQLGFEVTTLGARVRWMVPAEIPHSALPRTHMLLLVTIDGERLLVDGGFGGLGVTAPLRLDFDGEQASLFEAQRIVVAPTSSRAGRLLQAKVNHEWRDLYVFTEEAQHPVDFEMGNWFTSTHPSSRFLRNLIVAAAGPGIRTSLFNRELSVYRDGRVEKSTIDDPERLIAVLASSFGLSFPSGTRFGAPGSPWAR